MNTEWQPIETAPTDGTKVIMYDQRHAKSPIITGQVKKIQAGDLTLFEWVSDDDYIYHPTHWLPLPKQPIN